MGGWDRPFSCSLPAVQTPPENLWLSNTADPRDLRYKPSPNEHDERGRMAWIEQNVIGLPKATAAHTREQLQAMGYVGIYAPSPIQIFEVSFAGSDVVFESPRAHEVARWFVDRGLVKHPRMMDRGYWVKNRQDHLANERLEQWIKTHA